MPSQLEEQLLRDAAQGNLAGVLEALENGAAIDARDSWGSTALNEAAENGHPEVVKALLAAGADVHNRGGADKTPIMNAAFAGHVAIVQLLLKHGARVSNDLLSSVELKVNILKENCEAGMVTQEGLDAWQEFLDYLGTERLRQDMTEIAAALSSADRAESSAALERIGLAAKRGLDISAAVPRLCELTRGPDADARYTAGSALCARWIRAAEWDQLRQLCETGDGDVKAGVMSVAVSAAQAGLDLRPFVPALTALMGESVADLRHDAAITLGYTATRGFDVSGTVPNLALLLADPESGVRKAAGWALYRIAKYLGDISAAVPALQARLADEVEEVRDMAGEALKMAESRAPQG